MSGNRAGAVLMLLGMAAFAMNDALGKWLVADYGVAQVVLLRSLAAGVMMAPFLLRGGGTMARLRAMPRPGLQALRAACATAEVFLFYLAVSHMPLAEVMAFWMAAPIYILALSPLLLRERVGAATWAAVAAGFAGVLILLAPSGHVATPGAVFALMGTAAFAVIMVLGRSLRQTPDRDLVLFQIGAAGLAGLVLAPLDWQPVASAGDLGLLFLLGVVATAAHLLVTRSLKLAEASVVAPLQYSLLLWGALFGFLLFGDVPDRNTLGGAALIVGSGLIVLRRTPANG
ncbi:DMT family transporter [Falsirhodobacter sp. 20TX0035]|uniref:DMT family transporter n=1 Tax=Falsirhodobacter sp. 20TX0035 TaxID=3022019 RepID=UPI00232F6129|nr:DMT family transporter [Falsirhodobacter sp. 20TX0035]MDB6454768.1 DMT family transporter [Falsirhodobacter sp. 20TX0035]